METTGDTESFLVLMVLAVLNGGEGGAWPMDGVGAAAFWGAVAGGSGC